MHQKAKYKVQEKLEIIYLRITNEVWEVMNILVTLNFWRKNFNISALLFQQLLPISQNHDGLNVSFDNRKMDQEWFSLKWNVGSGRLALELGKALS